MLLFIKNPKHYMPIKYFISTETIFPPFSSMLLQFFASEPPNSSSERLPSSQCFLRARPHKRFPNCWRFGQQRDCREILSSHFRCGGLFSETEMDGLEAQFRQQGGPDQQEDYGRVLRKCLPNSFCRAGIRSARSGCCDR